MTNELHELSVSQLAAGIAARRFSPVDVVEAHLVRIEKFEPRLHAFVKVYGADARLAERMPAKAKLRTTSAGRTTCRRKD